MEAAGAGCFGGLVRSRKVGGEVLCKRAGDWYFGGLGGFGRWVFAADVEVAGAFFGFISENCRIRVKCYIFIA